MRWIEPQPVTVPDALQEAVGGHPIVARTLARRGVRTVAEARAFLDPDAYTPAPPAALPGLERAVERIIAALRDGERLAVWGDFDVDGQTATTLLVDALRDLSRDLGGDVVYHIPVRAEESHGVTIPHLEQLLDEGPTLLLTCDTGVRAHAAVDYANARGVDVVITDHHELPAGSLPAALAVINPHRLPADHPLGTLPGVAVAYKLAQALYARVGRPADVTRHLDLVALGIVADVATQTGDARYLLQRGMAALRETQRLGLKELARVARISLAQLNTEHIGFGLGPRLNAIGRLGDANLIVDFLTTTDLAQARIIASRLEQLNQQRRRLCDQVEAEAPLLLEHAALVVAGRDWHPGVIGIVASRLVERYHRPTVLLSVDEETQRARGSARSVEGVNIIEAITTQADLLEGFGGHAMAAGMALPFDRVPAFRRGLSEAVRAQVGEAPPPPTLQLADYLPLEALTLELVDELERLAPFGEGNPLPVLATRDVRVRHHRTLGRDKKHLKVMVGDADETVRPVLWWRAQAEELPEGVFDLAYTVRANVFRGERGLQITWIDARRAPEPEIEEVERPPARVRPTVRDYRREPSPRTLLIPLQEQADLVIWSEGGDGPGVPRDRLAAAERLVVWTRPPSPAVLAEAVAQVGPREIIAFAEDPGLDELRPFMERLMGAVKYALRHNGGEVPLVRLAGALAHCERTVRQGIAWLAARGHVEVLHEEEGTLWLARGDGKPTSDLDEVTATLRALLREAAAYRRYYVSASPKTLSPSA